ncbi:MAG TPA: hypothetical protein VFD30_05430 [Terriglobia bacterium]|nr:hypothetical protein [Terriglobia bacterium]
MRGNSFQVCAVLLGITLGLVVACGCKTSLIASADAQTRSVTHGSFTPTSRVIREDENTWLIAVEALLPPPDPGSAVIVADKTFKLPPNGTITKVQGTFGFIAPFGNTSYTSCTQPNAALGLISVDGKHIPFAIHVDSGGHRDRDIFLSYDIPIKYSNGNAYVHVEANPFGCWSDVEIQALVRVEFH